jgi:hypothetical protein
MFRLLLYRLLILLLLVLLIAICAALFSMRGIFGNLEPETMNRQTLIRVIQLRDFRQFSPDLLERLTNRAEQEFGRHSPNKPIIELPFLEKRIHVYFQANRSIQQSFFENNLTLMARVRYFQWMYEHQSAILAQRATLMTEVVEDMRYWQELYFDYLRYLEQPLPTPLELIEDFNRMIEEFKVGASPEEIELIDSFAQTLSQKLFFVEVQNTIFQFFVR